LGGEWITLFEKSDHVFLFKSIEEFAPGDITKSPTSGLILLGACLVSLCLSATGIRPHFGGVLVAICTSLAAGVAVKFTPFALISVAALIANLSGDFNRAGEENGGIGSPIFDGLVSLKRSVLSLESQTLGAIVFFIGALGFINLKAILNNPINYSSVPKTAIDFIDKNALAHPVLNEFGAGGYLQYRWSNDLGEPQHEVAIDGRTNVNPKEIWDAYMSTYRGREDWHNYLDMVKARTVVWRRGGPLYALLVQDPNWCLVFEDGRDIASFAVFIDRAQFNERLSAEGDHPLVAKDCT
jgi:hypothetical protein